MSNQPQASVRKSTTWTPPAGSLSAVGEPLPPPTRSTLLQERPRNSCVCVCQGPRCHHSPPSPAPPWGSVHTNSRLSASGWIPCSVSAEAFSSIQTTVRTCVFDTTIPFCKLEASNWDDSAEQKWVRVMTSEVFLGQKYWLQVSCLRNFQRIHNSAFSKEVPALKGAILAFIKTLCTLGKLIEVRKRREKDKKANTLAKQGKKMFLYQSRLKNDIRRLWKLASELSMHVFCLSLPGVFKNIPSLGSEISGVLSFLRVVSISRNFYKEKIKWKENYSPQILASCLNSGLPVIVLTPTAWKKLVKSPFPLLFSSVTVLCLAIVFFQKLIA